MTTEERESQSIGVYASSEQTLLDDLESVIDAVSGQAPEREPKRVVGRVVIDPVQAHGGAITTVQPYEPGNEPTAVLVPPKVRDLDAVPVGPDQVAIVRIVPAHDRLEVRAAAVAGLLLAIGFLLFLLAL